MTPAESDHPVAVLLQELGPALVLYARTWAGRDEAEDVVQRVFVRFLTSKRWPTEPRSWLFRCVRNEAISWRRSIRRRILRERERAESAEAIFEGRPGESIEVRESQMALEHLPAHLREIVVLRIWSGLSLAEISAITGLAVSTVHDQYQAALGAMRTQLEPLWKNTIR
jgi:RNA polymerase sigma-70 factor (ECF subfamily)